MTGSWPSPDRRLAGDFRAELETRARAVLGGAEPGAGNDDWLAALIKIVAQMQSEVSRRLNRVPEKQQRNFAAWLGVEPLPARAARLAAVFQSAAGPGAAVLTVDKEVKLRSPPGAIFETEDAVTILPGAINALAAVAGDRIMLPPPGLFDPATLRPQPIRRELVSLVKRGADQLQVAPALGLAAGGLISVGGREYRIAVEPKVDLVKIEPPLEADAPEGSEVVEVTAFAPVSAAAGGGASSLQGCMAGRSVPAGVEATPSAGAPGKAGSPRDWQAHGGIL